MEQQQATILVVTDLSAAFDTVNHDILLSVLTRDLDFKKTFWIGLKLTYVQETLKCA